MSTFRCFVRALLVALVISALICGAGMVIEAAVNDPVCMNPEDWNDSGFDICIDVDDDRVPEPEEREMFGMDELIGMSRD